MKINKDYTNKYIEFFSSRPLRWVMGFTILGVTMHWFFQGLLYMDRTERAFKIFLDVFFTTIISLILSIWLSWTYAILSGFLIAHTLNFLFNGQIWVVLKHYGYVNKSNADFEFYIQGITGRINAKTCFTYAAIYGSFSRDQWKPSSDLDVRLVRYPGWINGFESSTFVLFERTRAILNSFPLDIYLLDSFQPLSFLREDELPIILLGESNNQR